MADTFPPSNLPPDSAPWGRAVQEATTAASNTATEASLSANNLVSIQKVQGEAISTNNADRVRDIKAVNDELSRRYLELKAVNDQQNVRLGQHDTKLQEHAITLGQHGEELWSILNQLIPGLDSRVGGLEDKLTLATATSIDGMEFVAVSGGTWYKVPQSVGSPLGGPVKWPLPLSQVTDEYGPRESPGGIGSTFHRGMDFGGGGPIKAAGRGTVIFAGPNGGLGNWVEIRHSPTLVTGYGHMAPGSPIVTVGQAVAQGQEIGTMGTTGTSTGIHLHFETHVNGVQVNPRDVINGTDHV